MSSQKRVPKTLIYKKKIAAVREVKNGLKTKSLIAKEISILFNTLSTYLEKKENILKRLTTSSKKDRKRAREPESPDVDECVWFKQTRDKKMSTEWAVEKSKS